MSREIRRVPSGWLHPKDAHGYVPLCDEDYESALAEWKQERVKGEDDPLPDPGDYRQKFLSEPTHYQVYETVSEGTPTSPVFASLEEMKSWLIEKGFSEHAVSMFVEIGYAPSMVFTPERGVSGLGIHSLDYL